jgi:hypothetical protein
MRRLCYAAVLCLVGGLPPGARGEKRSHRARGRQGAILPLLVSASAPYRCDALPHLRDRGGATPSTARPSVTVQPGDSWASVRNRMFPLDALKRGNPGLDPEMLHAGDVVRAPYMPVAELDSELAARAAVESRLAETKARLTEIENDRASIETWRREVDRAKGTLFSLRVVVIGLVVVVIILLALLAFLVEAVRVARRNAAEAASRCSALQSRYEGLRQSLHELDVRLQQRIVSLLHLHGGKIVSDAELKSSMRTVLDFTQELKKKHESA